EKYFSKAKILQMYLNVVEFGSELYGVRNASHYYFQKGPDSVNPEEAAFLAFLLPNPKKYSQSFKKRELTPFASRTVKTILHRMAISHKITEDEYQASLGRVNLIWGGSSTPDIPYSSKQDIFPTETGATDDVPVNAGMEDTPVDAGM